MIGILFATIYNNIHMPRSLTPPRSISSVRISSSGPTFADNFARMQTDALSFRKTATRFTDRSSRFTGTADLYTRHATSRSNRAKPRESNFSLSHVDEVAQQEETVDLAGRQAEAKAALQANQKAEHTTLQDVKRGNTVSPAEGVMSKAATPVETANEAAIPTAEVPHHPLREEWLPSDASASAPARSAPKLLFDSAGAVKAAQRLLEEAQASEAQMLQEKQRSGSTIDGAGGAVGGSVAAIEAEMAAQRTRVEEAKAQLETSKSAMIKRLDFELTWGYPGGIPDFLDGSCLVFSEKEGSFGATELRQLAAESIARQEAGISDDGDRESRFNVEIVDWENRKAVPGISHSGDITDDAARQGKQTMAVDLAMLPQVNSISLLPSPSITIHHPSPSISLDLAILPQEARWLFFVLSSFKAADLTAFVAPSLMLRDGSVDGALHKVRGTAAEVLATYDAGHAVKSQALLVCAAQRDLETGGWTVEGLGVSSEGNTQDYESIQAKCEEVVAHDLFVY